VKGHPASKIMSCWPVKPLPAQAGNPIEFWEMSKVSSLCAMRLERDPEVKKLHELKVAPWAIPTEHRLLFAFPRMIPVTAVPWLSVLRSSGR